MARPGKGPTVSVVVVTHNRKDLVRRCIASVEASSYAPGEIIVVDNGSFDGTAEELQRSFSDIKVMRMEENLLPAAAANAGIRASFGSYVLVMADDNAIDKRMIEQLVEAAERSGAGILGPKMMFGDDPNRIWGVGGKISLKTGRCRFPHAGQMDRGQADQPWEPDVVHNALFLARWALERIGLFDARNFRIHNEEADLCLRARRDSIRILSVPQGKLWHGVSSQGELVRIGSRDFGVESPMRAFFTARNRVVLVRKHGTLFERTVFLAVFLLPITVIYLMIILTKPRRLSILRAYLSGTWAGVWNPVHTGNERLNAAA